MKKNQTKKPVQQRKPIINNTKQNKKPIQKRKSIPQKSKNYIIGLLIIVIAAVTVISYIQAFDNDFTNWDDTTYVLENPTINKLSVDNIKTVFSEPYMGNYHPLAMISLMIDYQLSNVDPKIEPTVFHFSNILIHTINSILVFVFVFMLFKHLNSKSLTKLTDTNQKKSYNYGYLTIAAISAILFGIHTLHVESVAWVAERKDVLYSLFFISALIFYVKYLQEHSWKYYIIAILLFILSLLSKGQAVSLSITIIAIDFLVGRKLLSGKVIIEKIPFIILSVIFGLAAIWAQQSTGSIATEGHSISQKLIFSSYGFTQYIVKLIAPIDLSAMYPYPKTPNGNMPIEYTLHLIPTILVILSVIYAIFKSGKNTVLRAYAYAILFFAINIFLVLQLLQVGGAIMSDRYSYIPSIGFFILIGIAIDFVAKKGQAIKLLSYAGVAVYAIFLMYLTFNRTEIWKDSLTLWNDVLSKETGSAEVWVNRANCKYELKDYKGSLSDFDNALKEKANLPEAWAGRGVIKRNLGDFKGAIADYDKALSYKPNDHEAYSNRGVSKASLNDLAGAMADFNKSLEIKGDYAMGYSNRGSALFKMGHVKKNMRDSIGSKETFTKALSDYNKALELNPNYADAYANRGGTKYELGNSEEAIIDYDKAVALKPDYPLAYFNRGMIKYNAYKDYKATINDCTKALEFRNNYPEAYYIRGLAKIKSEQKQQGCIDLQQSLKLGFKRAANEITKYCTK